MAAFAGLNLCIVNPNDRQMMDAIFAARVLLCEDSGARAYIARMAAEPEAALPVPAAAQETLEDAIERGLAGAARARTKLLLRETDGLTIAETRIIPALDRVGDKFDRGACFLPQLIQSAEAAQASFEIIKEALLSGGGAPIARGTMLLATVRGDIHDIGKNIVRVILENYGYRVIDLGRDVPPEAVVARALSQNVRLVGLSALMTTTVPAMRETIERLHEAVPDCFVFVGGAVLTADYARSIGADAYARDARAAVEIAKTFFGG